VKNYALIENGIVVNISVANIDWDSTGWVEYEYAGIGWHYDGTNFYPPQPFSSWSLDDNYDWQPPVTYPADGKFYTWSEDDLNWIEAIND
jgi:hypothetical protein